MARPWRGGVLALAALGIALAALGVAHAQQPSETGDGVQLESVDVTGRRALQDRFFAPGSTYPTARQSHMLEFKII